ncbi:ABC transporter ATP-binding protein [Guptibacillus algicola]|uniref:ABC transporter ATP-binding protein n=1 Tax=Guptibacillus algicola TaxID=225844 RepID=UPI001CD6FA69|nr:ABC transporter ATP-binding protein [Alkalihalobacillus algicola]MCA0986662.1 ABC transporter ATP-binding protein [Alkalihalobacillus algicola]
MSRLYAEDLKVAYGEREIVKNLKIDIPDREITTIIGPNGCGKSTVLKALSRILNPKSGTVYLDGKSISKESTKKIAQKMAILPQAPDSPDGLTVGELVSYGRYPYQKGFGKLTKKDYNVIDWALSVTGILDYKERPVDALSGGQRQRVWIAMALAQETDIILLDEPTTYLDLSHQLEVLELLHQLNRDEKRTIVMVIHDLNHAARFAHHMVAMKEGSIVKEGKAEEVMTHKVLFDVFNIDAEIGVDPRTRKPVCLTYDLVKSEQYEKNLA